MSQQKYLELLEANKTTSALYVLRNELAPLDVDTDLLHTLSRYAFLKPTFCVLCSSLIDFSSFMMCSEPEDLRQRAGWDGAAGLSRRRLLNDLQRTSSAPGVSSADFAVFRLYSLFHHDSTTAVLDITPTSTIISTTTMRIPQLTLDIYSIFSIY